MQGTDGEVSERHKHQSKFITTDCFHSFLVMWITNSIEILRKLTSMNRFFFPLLFFAMVTNAKKAAGQNAFFSESLIKYDLTNHSTDKPIPFDRSFTLIIEKLSAKNIESIEAYEVAFIQGNRVLVENSFTDCDQKKRREIVKDMNLRFNPDGDTLRIFFPPVKPNKYFDVFLISKLPVHSRNALLDVNSKIAASDPKAGEEFQAFSRSMVDKQFDKTVFAITDFSTYQQFYNTNLAPLYADIRDPLQYTKGGLLSELQVQAIDIATSKTEADFKDGNKLLEASKRSLWADLQLGLIDINKVFLPNNLGLTTMPYGHSRLKNMESNLAFFDSVYQRLNRVLSKGDVYVTVGLVQVLTSNIRNDLSFLKNHLQTNYDFLKAKMKIVAARTDRDPRIRSGNYLAGNTVSSDLKTAGGNSLFLDAGISNIFAPGLNDRLVYMPKLYLGASIYFRPIDKNTRRNKFFKNFSPGENKGCRRTNHRNSDGSVESVSDSYGPDYGIATKRSIWQRLSLNIGVTTGAMVNKDFENFFNETSLLVGPGCRLARGFKLSGGLALLRRTSKNPLKSDKQIVFGSYISLSADIDLIQGIKDITSILFK